MTKKNRFVATCGALLAIAVVLLLTGRLSAGEDDTKAEKAIKALGGNVVRDDKAEGKPVIIVHFQDTKVTDTGLKELAGLKSLQHLYLNNTDVTDAGLKELASLKNLEVLVLR